MQPGAVYVAQLPEVMQEDIRAEVTAALTAEGVYSVKAVQEAMDSKLEDLEEVLNPTKYAPYAHTMNMGMQ